MINLDSLNDKQREAVQTTDGPLMILAGAGSGKTKTVATKVAYTLDKFELSPFDVLALTFSNKAAREMRERISQQLGVPENVLMVTTFHSFCARILRTEYRFLGLTSNFTIYDDQESLAMIKNILSLRGISIKEVSPYAVHQFIDEIKNTGYYLGKEKQIDEEKNNLAKFEEDAFFSIYQDYESEILKSNGLDFGGLIVGVLRLFYTNNEILRKYQNKFKFVFVDEFQDTNRAQFELLHLLTSKHQKLCVVGDEDQSIYSWRGADIRNILNFNSAFPEAKLIKLEQNYRSSQVIINASSSVIANNMNRSDKELWTENDEGELIEIKECDSDLDESSVIGEELNKLRLKGVPLKEIAVFYRNNSQSRAIEDQLRRNNIQYRIIGGIKFYDRREIKDIIAYLRIVVNPRDSLALNRVINVPPRGIGAVSLKKIEDYAINNNLTLWDVILALVEDDRDIGVRLTSKARSALRSFSENIKRMMDLNGSEESPSDIIPIILNELGLLNYYQGLGKDIEAVTRIENIEEFVSAIKHYENKEKRPSISLFLESITLDKSEVISPEGEVSLMTIHAAKGLEFSYVFVCGVEENLFPSFRSVEKGGETGIEEERRLFYVAMTRAKAKLYLLFAQTRMQFGSIRFNGPSRFLFEVPKKYVNWEKVGHNSRKGNDSYESYVDLDGIGDSYSASYERGYHSRKGHQNHKYPIGTVVYHNLYGEGRVREILDHGDAEKIVVHFSDGTQKKLMVKYAPLRHIEYD